MKYAVLFLLAAAMLFLMPLAFIWAINTLFALGIDYGLKEWAAILILVGMIRPNITVKKK